MVPWVAGAGLVPVLPGDWGHRRTFWGGVSTGAGDGSASPGLRPEGPDTHRHEYRVPACTSKAMLASSRLIVHDQSLFIVLVEDNGDEPQDMLQWTSAHALASLLALEAVQNTGRSAGRRALEVSLARQFSRAGRFCPPPTALNRFVPARYWGRTVCCARAVRKVGHSRPVFPDGQVDRSNYRGPPTQDCSDSYSVQKLI